MLLWSTVATAFKIALNGLDYVQLLFIASWASTLSLAATLIFSRRGEAIVHPAPGLKRSALMGFINPLLYYLILFKAYSILPAQEAQSLNWTWPLTLTIFSALFLGQRLTARGVGAIGLSFVGVLLIVTRGDLTSFTLSEPLGDILAVGSSLLWAGYWVLNLKDKRDPVEKLFWNFLFGSLYATVALMVLSGPPAWELKYVAAGVYVGFFEMGLAFVLWLRALGLARNTASVGSLAYLTPFLSLVFIHFILRETLHLSAVAGLTLIVSGIIIQQGKSKKKQKNR